MVGRRPVLPEVHRRPGHRRRVPPRRRLRARRPAHGTTRAADRRLPQHHARRGSSTSGIRRSSHAVEWGRSQLATLAPRCRLGLADSEFNRTELASSGYRPTAVTPILIDLEAFDRDFDEAEFARLQAAKANGRRRLAVRRAASRRTSASTTSSRRSRPTGGFHDPQARLHIVGGVASEPYAAALRAFVRTPRAHRLRRPHRASVRGRARRALPQRRRLRVPLGARRVLRPAARVDAPPRSRRRVRRRPPFPRRSTGPASACPTRRRPWSRQAVHRVVTDDELRAKLLAAGERRLSDFTLERSRARFLEAMAPVLDGAVR